MVYISFSSGSCMQFRYHNLHYMIIHYISLIREMLLFPQNLVSDFLFIYIANNDKLQILFFVNLLYCGIDWLERSTCDVLNRVFISSTICRRFTKIFYRKFNIVANPLKPQSHQACHLFTTYIRLIIWKIKLRLMSQLLLLKKYQILP